MIQIETVTGHTLQARITKLMWDAEVYSQTDADSESVARFVRLTFQSIVNGSQISIVRDGKKLVVDLRD